MRLNKTGVLGLLIVLQLTGGAFFFGRATGKNTALVGEGAACALTVPATARERNIVWRVWNGEVERLPDSPEKNLAIALFLVLQGPDPQNRNEGITLYAQKSILYFSEEEAARMKRTIYQGSPRDRAEVFGKIAAADAKGAELVRSVLADRERINFFLEGKPIPLETIPDG